MSVNKAGVEAVLSHEDMGLEARASKEDHQSLRVWLRLLSCSTEIEAEIRRRLRSQFDMSLAHFDYLAQLHRHPQGLSMRSISRYLMVTGGNVTGLTDELESQGLVAREVAPDDRRSYCVKLTAVGRRSFEQVASVHESWVVEFFGGLKAAERDLLNGLLGQLRLHLAQTLKEGGATPAPSRRGKVRSARTPDSPVRSTPARAGSARRSAG